MLLLCSGVNSVAVYVLFSDTEINDRNLVSVAQKRMNLFHMNAKRKINSDHLDFFKHAKNHNGEQLHSICFHF